MYIEMEESYNHESNPLLNDRERPSFTFFNDEWNVDSIPTKDK